MPCLFGSALHDQTMALHAKAVVRLARNVACGAPLVLAGDFNVVPGAAVHRLLLGGGPPPGDAAWPPCSPRQPIEPSDTGSPGDPEPPLRLRSAYAEALGAEPDFTIRSWRAEASRPFVGTLDYIFVGEGVTVRGVRELPPATAFADESVVFPDATEPSDHMLVAADLALGAESLPETCRA